MKCDLPKVRELASNSKDLKSYIDGFFQKCVGAGDPPYMSDLLDPSGGGLHFMVALEDRYTKDRKWPEHMRFKWHLKVRYDEYGKPPVPGEKVVILRQKPIKLWPGDTTRDINTAKINGTYEEDFQERLEFVIDDKGCITVEYEEAAYLLRRWGIHGKSGAVLSMYKAAETSGGKDGTEKPPKDADGKRRNVWYWRYHEVDKEMYEALPVLTKSKKVASA